MKKGVELILEERQKQIDKGYDVNWNGEKLTSEYFINGSDIRKI